MESNEKIRQQFFKMNFLKKLWYSISKFERYPEMASLGVKKSILYFTELILIVSIVFTSIYVYNIQTNSEFEQDKSFSQKVVEDLIKKNNLENEKINEMVKD